MLVNNAKQMNIIKALLDSNYNSGVLNFSELIEAVNKKFKVSLTQIHLKELTLPLVESGIIEECVLVDENVNNKSKALKLPQTQMVYMELLNEFYQNNEKEFFMKSRYAKCHKDIILKKGFYEDRDYFSVSWTLREVFSGEDGMQSNSKKQP